MRLFRKKKHKAAATVQSSPTKPSQDIDLFSKPTAEETTVGGRSSSASKYSQRSTSVASSSKANSSSHHDYYMEEIVPMVISSQQVSQQQSRDASSNTASSNNNNRTSSQNSNTLLLQSHHDILQASSSTLSASQKVVHDAHQSTKTAAQPSLQRISSHKKRQSALQKLLCFDKSLKNLKQHTEEAITTTTILEYLPPEEEARQDQDELLSEYGGSDSARTSIPSPPASISIGTEDQSMVASVPPPPPPKSVQSCTSSVSHPIPDNTNEKKFVSIGNGQLMAVGGNGNGNALTTTLVDKIDMPTRNNTLTKQHGKLVATKTAGECTTTSSFKKLLCFSKNNDVFDDLEKQKQQRKSQSSFRNTLRPNFIDAKTKDIILPVVLEQEAASQTESSSQKSTFEILEDLVIRPTWVSEATMSVQGSMRNMMAASILAPPAKAAVNVAPVENGNVHASAKDIDNIVPDIQAAPTTESTLMQTCHDITKHVLGNFLLIPQIEEKVVVDIDKQPHVVDTLVVPPVQQQPSQEEEGVNVETTLREIDSDDVQPTDDAAKTLPAGLDTRDLVLHQSLSNCSSMTRSTVGSTNLAIASSSKDKGILKNFQASSKKNEDKSILKKPNGVTSKKPAKDNEKKPKLSRAGVKFAAFDLPSRSPSNVRNEIAWQRCKARRARTTSQRRAATRKGCIKKNCRENVTLASIAESDHENDDEPKAKSIMPNGLTLFPSMVACQGPYGQHDSDEEVAIASGAEDGSVSLQGLNHKLYRTSSPVPRFPDFQSALFSSNPSNSFEDDDDSVKLKRLEKLKREHHSEASSWMYYLFAKDDEADVDDDNATIEGNDSLVSFNRSVEGTFSKSGSEDELEVTDGDGNARQSLWKFRGESIQLNGSMDSNVEGSNFGAQHQQNDPNSSMPIKLYQKSIDESSIVGALDEDKADARSHAIVPVRISLAL